MPPKRWVFSRSARPHPHRARALGIAAVLIALAVAAYWLAAPAPEDELGASQWRQLVGRFVDARARPTQAGPAPEPDSPAAAIEPATGATSSTRPGSGASPLNGPSPAAVTAEPAAPPAGSATDAIDREPPVRLPREPIGDGLLANRQREYAASRPKSILELQRYRTDTTAVVVDRGTGRRGRSRLVNLNPEANAWYLLEVTWEGSAPQIFHLVNADPRRRDLALQEAYPDGLVIVDSHGTQPCPLWDGGSRALAQAAGVDAPYVPLCDGAVMLRRPSTGRKSTMERVTDFLRDNVWGGEKITVFVRETFFRDAFLETGEVTDATAPAAALPEAPPSARVAPEYEGKGVRGEGLGLPVRGGRGGPLPIGRWLPVAGSEGIWLSAIEPRMLPPAILSSHRDVRAPLDEVEMTALSYMVAFDLARFEVGFSLGTDHPRLGWSERVPEERRDPSLPGPDGFSDAAPLISTGIVPASQMARIAAAFTGGFKRSHGGFLYGDLALVNQGSHYGFIESGVIFSKLQPGLATLYVTADGTVGMKTWEAADNELLPRILHARQNGVPILERTTAGVGAPTAMISRYGAGNWSGSQDGRYRTLRAGACIVEAPAARYLVYGYFSSATPSAMAVVFQGYGCDYAMILDMNALEHTYLATYRLDGGSLAVSHLIEGMSVLDKEEGGQPRPRFLAFSDNRDFFYVLRRTQGGTR